jgi:hypothetical protein
MVGSQPPADTHGFGEPAPTGGVDLDERPTPVANSSVSADEPSTASPALHFDGDSRVPGWYPDPADPNATSYWDGSRITSRRRWNGNAWVDQDSAPQPTVAAASKPTAFDARATLGTVSEKLATVKVPKRLGFIGLAAGCAAIAIGALMPWAKTSARGIELYSSGPKSGASVMFIVLAGIALVVGWPLIQDGISRVRALGLGAVVALLGLFAVTNWASLADAQPESNGSDVLKLNVEVTAGGGLLLYTLGVLVLVAVAGLAFLRGKATARAA